MASDDVVRGWTCRKRDGNLVPFDPGKVRGALGKCFASLPEEPGAAATIEGMVWSVVGALASRGDPAPGVELIQQLVLQQLWSRGLFAHAEHYQNHRELHRKKRVMESSEAFDRRVAFKPFDYPKAEEFKYAIQRSPWIGLSYDFTSDVQDLRVGLSPAERGAVVRSLLAISQVEVAVKRFWAKLGDRLPRPEFEQVGIVFAESEVRHADAYSRVLDVLGLGGAFSTVTEVPAMRQRIDYLTRSMQAGLGGTDRGFARTLTTFALLVENMSLFGQFAVVKSFSRARGVLQNVDNVVQATMKEEQVHALFGAWLTNLIRSERPEWFDSDFYGDLGAMCREAFAAESAILDWIFEDGDVASVSRPALAAFLRDRVNQGVAMVGGDPVFEVDASDLAETAWFREELAVPIEVDFFHKHSTNYCTPVRAATPENMW